MAILGLVGTLVGLLLINFHSETTGTGLLVAHHRGRSLPSTACSTIQHGRAGDARVLPDRQRCSSACSRAREPREAADAARRVLPPRAGHHRRDDAARAVGIISCTALRRARDGHNRVLHSRQLFSHQRGLARGRPEIPRDGCAQLRDAALRHCAALHGAARATRRSPPTPPTR